MIIRITTRGKIGLHFNKHFKHSFDSVRAKTAEIELTRLARLTRRQISLLKVHIHERFEHSFDSIRAKMAEIEPLQNLAYILIYL